MEEQSARELGEEVRRLLRHHLAAGRVDAVCSLKPARSIDIAAAQLLVRERGYAIELFEDPPFAVAPLDLEGRSRVVAAATGALCESLAAALR
jgi:myo-inositol-1(or 4)-monophosphatase